MRRVRERRPEKGSKEMVEGFRGGEGDLLSLHLGGMRGSFVTTFRG